MVRTDIRPIKLEDIYLKITDTDAYGLNESFEIASAFQRGSEGIGVWTFEAQQNYIISLKSRYPTGIITLVKEHAASGQTPWKVLDGGNRLRTIRGFVSVDGFGIKLDEEDGVFRFADFSEKEKADFQTLLIPCQFITIERDDPDHTIADMYCSLNTSTTKLSTGELYKAHGWKSDNWAIELAKKMIGDPWESVLSDSRFDTLRASWELNFGFIEEGKRCESLAMMIGYIASASTSNFANFDSKYMVNKKILSTLADKPSEDEINVIFIKLAKFITIMSKIVLSKEAEKDMFARPRLGIPIKAKVAPIWKLICENKMTDELSESMIRFYNVHANNSLEVRAEYNKLLTKGGDNHATSAKINAVHEYIKSFN